MLLHKCKNGFFYRLTGLILFYACFYYTDITAQSVSFDHFTVKDGISQSEIICIFQDTEGYLWFGTQNGLNKFDGYTFEKYFRDPTDIHSLSNNWIFSIAEDPEGNLFVGTKGGLNKFNKKTGHFSQLTYKSDNSVVQDNFVYGLATSGSLLYVNTPPVLTEINLINNSVKTCLNHSGYTGALYDRGSPVIIGKNGIVWTGTHNGLYAFNPVNKNYTDYLHNEQDNSTLSHNHITALFEDHGGNILIGTENGLNILSPETNKIFRYLNEPTNPASLSHNFIRSVFRDHEGIIWIGTEGGGLNKMKWDEQTGKAYFEHFRSSTDVRYSVSHNIVYALYEDKSCNLWIGTIAGIDKTNLKKKNIFYYKRTDNPAFFDLPDNIIASVYKDKSGKIWIGSWGKGLFILDRNSRHIIHYNAESSGLNHIPGNHVHVIFEDSKSQIWIGTRNGVSVYNSANGKFIPAHEYFQAPEYNCFNSIRVYCIMEDSNGQIWVGTGNGIRILDVMTKDVTIIKSEGEGPVKISSNLVYSVLEDNDHEIWIATSEGLDCYFPETNKVVNYLSSYTNPNTICDNFTISLHKDDHQNIWIGTVSGLNRFNKDDSVFYYYSTKDGLPSNIIYDIIEDSNGNFWFSTGSGLAFSDKPAERFQVVHELRGLEFNLKAVFRSADGEMFFGGIDGLVSFYPDSLAENKYIPPVRITSFEKEREGLRKKINVYSDKIILSHKDYAFSIEFSSLDYTYPERNRFVYRMEGISDRWIELGNRRNVHFTNLPSGNYTFKVKGSNNDGIWNEQETSIKIQINPPLWKSKYAIIFYIILVNLLILMIIKLREKNLVREKRILELRVKERTAEIAYQKAKVEESEEKLSSVIRSLDDLVFVLDGNGVFREFYNPGKRETHYRHPDLYIDKYFGDAGLPESVTAQLSIIFNEIKKADDVSDFDYYLGPEEDRYWYNAKVSPKLNKKGELTGFVIVSRDISERKHAEQLMVQQKEDLKALNATKDKFFSILAHDLKNPFAHLFSISETIIRSYKELEEEEKILALENIHKAARFIYGLMENLLTWANVQRGTLEFTPEIFNLSHIIRMNVNLFRMPAESKGIHLNANIEESLMAFGDKEMINTVIRNLINNAVKFTSGGGSVNVEAEIKGNIVEIRIKDSGIGMTEEDIHKLFRIDVKFKSKGTAGETGTGLGLVLCREFVGKNRGTIRCESKLNEGTIFYVTIPAGKEVWEHSNV